MGLLSTPTVWGGRHKTKWKTASPNFKELIESIAKMLLFFSGGSRETSDEVSKLEGGRGGGSWPKIHHFFLHFSSHYSNMMMESYCSSVSNTCKDRA